MSTFSWRRWVLAFSCVLWLAAPASSAWFAAPVAGIVAPDGGCDDGLCGR